MMKYLCIILVLTLFSIGCTDRDDNISVANIRIKNNNSFTYDSVLVNEMQIYENISGGGFSEYLEYDPAFRSANVQIDTAGTQYTLQSDSLVNEIALSPGFYTYELELDAEGNITLDFRTD